MVADVRILRNPRGAVCDNYFIFLPAIRIMNGKTLFVFHPVQTLVQSKNNSYFIAIFELHFLYKTSHQNIIQRVKRSIIFCTVG